MKGLKQNKRIAIVVLGGGLVRDKRTGKWRTTNYTEGDNFGVQGDRLRVEAAGYLYKHNPNTFFITSGGKGQLAAIPDAVTVASVIKRELMKFDVPAANIIKEEKSGSTYTQLLAITQLIKKTEIKNNRIFIISNEWHLPRIKAMIEYLPQLKPLKKIKLISAEKICLQSNPQKWQKIINQAYHSQSMKQRIKLEKTGIRHMKAGQYKFK